MRKPPAASPGIFHSKGTSHGDSMGGGLALFSGTRNLVWRQLLPGWLWALRHGMRATALSA